MNFNLSYIVFFSILLVYLSCRVQARNVEPFADNNEFQSQVDVQNEKNMDQSSKASVAKQVEQTQRQKYIQYKQETYRKILEDTKEVLDGLRIPFFLSSGTLLGYFRDGKFIDHDYDIDIGIFKDDYNSKLIEKMEEKGLKLYRILGDEESGMELSFKREGTRLGRFAKIDIFLHYPEEIDGKEYYSWYTYRAPKFDEKIKYQVSKFNLEPVFFKDLVVNVPDPTETYIMEHYGDKWMIPRRAGVDYFYATSPKSIVPAD